jgi:UDP-N-acetylglucosamine 2-epimerase
MVCVLSMSDRAIRTVSIVGARPQFVKLSPVSRAMTRGRSRIDDRIVHTGQHYDDAMSRVFFEELELPQPAVNLGIGSGPQGWQTGRMLEAIEAYLAESAPDVVIVYGDTNSTLAGALAAAKLHIPVAHVEAGLRSFNRRMPEELNRVATDHLSETLFAPTLTAMKNLQNEGLSARAVLTGDVMYDAVLFYAGLARARSSVLKNLRLANGQFGIATIHRAENTARDELGKLLDALNAAAARFGQIVFPVHPRTSAVIAKELPDWRPAAGLSMTGPLGYLDMLALVQAARWVLTDSGGLQKEAFFLNCPCVTLRNETEWVETLENEANSMAGSDGARLEERLQLLTRRPRDFDTDLSRQDGPFGTGHAAERIVEAIHALGGSTP